MYLRCLHYLKHFHMYLGIFQDFQFCAICWSDEIIFYYYKVLVIEDFRYILTCGIAIPSSLSELPTLLVIFPCES